MADLPPLDGKRPYFRAFLILGPPSSLPPSSLPPLFSQCEVHGPPFGVGREKNISSPNGGWASPTEQLGLLLCFSHGQRR